MHPLLQQYQHTLLGRLRTKLFLQITGSTDRLPTEQELWRYLMPAWKQNALAAELQFHLIHLRGSRRVSFPTSMSRQQVRACLRDIVRKEPVWSLFAEGVSPTQSPPTGIGCVALGHTRPSGEPGYYAAIMSEADFPDCGFVSIAPHIRTSDSHIAVLGTNGWAELTVSQAGSHEGPCIALTAIQQHLPGVITVPLEQIKDARREDQPPKDPELMRRLELVLRGKMRLAKATVRRSTVRLFDDKFARTIDPAKVMRFINGGDHDLLVYWDGHSFVSSDDYYTYLGYQMLETEEVKVVIIGEFPSRLAKVESRGNHELLPPVVISRTSAVPGVSLELQAWQAREERLKDRRLATPADLLAGWVAFANVLGDETAKESALHKLLVSYPVILGAKWDIVDSEVHFGRNYKADLVLRANRALPTVCLVELERANHRLFTKDFHETDEVTHAVQQVSDWLRYCRQHPEDPVISASHGVSPDGLVVIGLSRHLSQRERETLAHNNQGRNVKVITYDELLDDFGTLILHRLDDGASVSSDQRNE
ncbi:MAG TPA: Shedu anti-phage system protein SduA domain-containing protein [Pyrinomonadaceae bacterium]|jgi:hypothetical protein